MAKNPRDRRTDPELHAAEAVLALPDPLETAEPTAPTLEDLCHVEMHGELQRFNHWVAAVLAPHRSDVPIQVPEFIQLRPAIQTCSGGMDGSHDASPAWRTYFGAYDDGMQSRVRSLWQQARALKCPPAERYSDFVDALAVRIVEIFTAAKQQQADRLKKRAAEHGPAVRAQAAASLLESAGPFTAALAGYTSACRDAGVNGLVADLSSPLNRLTRIARGDLA